ncbi:chromosome segregation protein SMC [Methanomicrobium mobile]|uniref:chromosome segregation protein SMC n=1 Tax=Methanomicrobium mobile TaxID=2205 RepID=UPI0005B2E14E|nr:chromosome segregation protein SMC [Methanomicrobium mobile]
MYITELEIDNFKSFGKKTKIPFCEGFTVVSGPNGSGKSNIIDSILFCLTLSGARGLRAEKLTDLINLNTNRNSAEVSITFSDNTKIRRRIKRTANGYYSYNYINDRPCKQSDVVEYLAKFGIKSEGYNVVMQGDITRIIEMSDGERRKIIDEIAGVSEFDKKKEQSLSELDIVRDRIEREELLLAELEKRLSELETEKAQAVKYRELSAKLEYYNSCLSAAKLRDCEAELLGIATLEADQEAKLFKLNDDKAAAEENIGNLHNEISSLDAEINAKSGDEYRALLAAIEESKGKINLAKQNIARLEQLKETKKTQIDKLFGDLKRTETKIGELTDEIRNLSIDRSNLNMELASLNADLTNVRKTLDEKSSSVEGAREKLTNLMSALDEKKEVKSGILNEQGLLIEKSRLRTEEKSRLDSDIQKIDEEINEKSGSLLESRKLVESLNAEKSLLDGELSKTESKLFENKNALEKVISEYRKYERELMNLEAMQRASGGPGGRGLEAILGMDGVYGTVRQLGKAPQEYAVALSTAAGGRMQNVVCESDQVAADGIRYLKDNSLGRATFLPLNKLRAPELPPLKNRDIIDYAVNLLDYDPLYDVVFRYIFGTTVVVKDLNTARKMIGQYRMVTLAGDIVEKAGAMTGGSQNRNLAMFGVSADNEIENIRAEMAKLSQEQSTLESAVARLTDEGDKKRNRRKEIADTLYQTDFLINENTRRIDELNEEKAKISARREEMAEEVKSGSTRLAEIEEELAKIGKEIAEVTAETDKLKRELANTGIPELTEQYERIKGQVDDTQGRLNKKDFTIQDAQREKKHFVSRLEELKGERAGIDAEIKSANDEIVVSRDEIKSNEAEVKKLQSEIDSSSEELKALQKKQSEARDRLYAEEKRVIEIDGEIDRLRLATNSLAERKTTLTGMIEELRGQAGDIETDMTLAEITAGIEKSEKEIKKIGAVNMLAIEEYEKTSERVAEKKEKKEVLSKERANILERIEHYEKMKFDTFTEAFNAIDKNFRKIFARLTEGQGSLVLENPSDPFSGGMTFAVQPRDKKVHLLSALSGGEKSLTTLAFIFSIQQYIPAPFYALDEIDMMLDGSNVERVSTMIAELSANAQTICVSLRRPTIDRSDRMIGVTIRPDKSTYVTGVKSNG